MIAALIAGYTLVDAAGIEHAEPGRRTSARADPGRGRRGASRAGRERLRAELAPDAPCSPAAAASWPTCSSSPRSTRARSAGRRGARDERRLRGRLAAPSSASGSRGALAGAGSSSPACRAGVVRIGRTASPCYPSDTTFHRLDEMGAAAPIFLKEMTMSATYEKEKTLQRQIGRRGRGGAAGRRGARGRAPGPGSLHRLRRPPEGGRPRALRARHRRAARLPARVRGRRLLAGIERPLRKPEHFATPSAARSRSARPSASGSAARSSSAGERAVDRPGRRRPRRDPVRRRSSGAT